MKFHSAAANGLATGTFQKCIWGQIDPLAENWMRIQYFLSFETKSWKCWLL